MHLDAKQWAQLMVTSDLQVAKLMLKYVELKQKLNNMDKRSWYFKRGKQNTEKELSELNSQYEKIRSDFEKYTPDELLDLLVQERAKIQAQPKIDGKLISEILSANNQSKLMYIEELIRLKKRIRVMKPIEHYLIHTDDLIELLGDW